MDRLKMLMVILDGLGDRPVEELGGKTPLEAANTPNMDILVKNGRSGLMDTIKPGIAPGSDTAHLALLGYDPYEVYSGRGPFEAAGEGINLQAGDVAFRCNFSTLDENGYITDRRAGRISSGTKELAETLNGMSIDGVNIIFKEAVDHRAVLVLRGSGLSPDVTAIDPHKTGTMYLQSYPKHKGAELTASVLNQFTARARDLLESHPVNVERKKNGLPPANIVLARGAGITPHVEKLEKKFGIKGVGIIGISLVKGVCRLVGMETPVVEGATGSSDTDMSAKKEATLKALETNDFILLHFKGTDVFSHDGDWQGKKEFIEKIDKAIGGIYEKAGKNTVIAVTGDHTTAVATGDHTADPIPLVIYAPGGRRDGTETFGETEAMGGGLGEILGKDLLPIMLDLSGRTNKFGA